MANKTIADYTAAISIDAANDYLLIEPSGNTVYKKINRNILLGLSSAPLGTTDSQSPTNKTFDNTNAFTTKDGSFTLQNTSSTTKQAVFSLASITAGQTRTLTVPDASLTLVGTATTQTLTNKTLTSPTITGGTIDNSTVTVDAISGHTSGTIVTVANLQISNGVLNSANAVTATSIAAGAIQPQALTTGTGTGWAYQSWTPTVANLTTGNGTLTAHYNQTGKTVFYHIEFQMGSTSSMGTGVTFSLPITAISGYGVNVSPIGNAVLFHAADSGTYGGAPFLPDTTHLGVLVLGAAGTYTNYVVSTATVPFTWATSDKLVITGQYEAA